MPDNVAELDLRRYLAVVKRRWPTMVASVGVLVAGSLALSLRQTPVYEGEARVLLQPQAGESLLGVQQRDVDPELAVATEIQVLKSGPVLARVLRQLGPVAKASASRVGETLLINVHGRSTSPRRAAQVATTYAQAYIDLRREQAVQDLLAVGQQVQGTVTELERELDRLDAEVGAAAAAQRGVAIESARSRRDALVTQHAFFRQRLGEIQVQAALKTG